MAGILDDLQRAAFNGVEFAVQRYSVKGGLRDHVHEYRHTPGGQPEKLGRKLYTVEFDAIFSTETPDFPNAYPGDLASLRKAFEAETTADLVVPTIGTIQAYATDWTQDVEFKTMRDGERCRFVFREDQTGLFLVDDIVRVDYATVTSQTAALEAEIEAADLDVDVFQQVLNLANAVQDVVGVGEFYAEMLLDRVSALVAACQRIDEVYDELNQPVNHRVGEALRDIGVSAIILERDLKRSRRPLITFVVPPITMHVAQISMAIYGTTERAAEIMQLNAFENPLAVAPGTEVQAYAPEE